MVRLAMLKLDHAMSLAQAAAGATTYDVAAHSVGHPHASGVPLHLRAG